LKLRAEDPIGVVETIQYPSSVRTLRGELPPLCVSSQIRDRVLLQILEPEGEDGEGPYSEGDDDEDPAPDNAIPIDHDHDSQSMPDNFVSFYMLEFDPKRINSLLALSDIERINLSHELQGAAQDGISVYPTSALVSRSPRPLVELVTRHYAYGPEEWEEDLEYSVEASTPKPWKSHLRRQRRERAAQSRPFSQISAGLVYDERPTNRRGQVLSVGSAHVRIKLLLPAAGYMDDRLALTDSGVLQIPKLGEAGRMYFYDWIA
jgi:hypothetical protein